jgi:hypothetical protein
MNPIAELGLMRAFLAVALLLVFAVPQLSAAEMANLRNGFTIRDERHETIGDITRLYMGKDSRAGSVDVATSDIESFEPVAPEPEPLDTPVPKTQDLNAIISSASARSQVDADFIASVIRAESANNPRAISGKGAQGLMQLMPETARNLGVVDSFDPADNVGGGVRYLRELLLRYNGDLIKTLAAYNAGPQRVQQYKGIPPYRETRAYITRVILDYNSKKTAKHKVQAKPALLSSSPEHCPAKTGQSRNGNPRPD